MTASHPICALTIAGSDSCGGAGIQADLKTFSAWGVEGASVVTAITAQNTLGVEAAEALGPDLVRSQLQAVFADLPISAAKTGMLANAAIIGAIAEAFSSYDGVQLVVDPVMVATSGARLLDHKAEQSLISQLLPYAALVTPNLPEAAVLTGLPADTPAEKLAEKILNSGCTGVLVKGGHGSDATMEDLLVTSEGTRRFSHRRVDRQIHGTGCALSAAITAGLARGASLETAVADGIAWLQTMITNTWQPLQGRLGMLPFGSTGRP